MIQFPEADSEIEQLELFGLESDPSERDRESP